jgi:hypothetical protein
MNYQTSIPFGPAVPQDMRQQALAGLGARPSLGFNGSANDAFDAYSAANRTAYDRAAQEADMDYMKQARDTQQQMALRGLEQMAQQYQQGLNLETQRQGMAANYINGILGGLFR